VLQRFQTALNQGDPDTAMQLVSEDIRFVGGVSCMPQAPCIGADSFRQRVLLSIANQVQTVTLGDILESGTTARMSVMVTSPGRASIGVDRTFSEVSAEVVDGTITSLATYPDSDDAQTLWWLDHRPDSYQNAQQGLPSVGLRPAP
jgi:hypothetical protein